MKMMEQWLAIGLVCMLSMGSSWGAIGTSGAVTVQSMGSFNVEGHALVEYPPFKVGNGDEAGIWLDGEVLFSTQGNASWDWQPQSLGEHELEFRLNGVVVTSKTVNVESLAFEVEEVPQPPTAAVPNISILSQSRHFGKEGGIYAIVTSGSGSWQAAASASWITLNATSGQAGYPVAYAVEPTPQAEGRTGYVYVSGHVHTVTQDGLEATISPTNAMFGIAGGTGTVTVIADDGIPWKARPNCDWASMSPAGGTGTGSVTFTVAPLNEIIARQGTLTVAGQTITVVQNGVPLEISPTSASHDYLAHTISVTVEALDIMEWEVMPSASWISVQDKGTGKGNGIVTLAIAENPSWKERSGTVNIGTETFTVTQGGRTALVFDISPATATANVTGATGKITVTATPDLPWSAKSQADWLILSGTTNGAGDGNVSYSAAANPTLNQRTGKMVVTPGDTSVSSKTLTVTQPAATSALSAAGHEFEAEGGSCEVSVSVSDNVQWQIQNGTSWITVDGTTSRVGPGTVTLQAKVNNTAQARSGTVTIAKKSFKVSQKSQDVEVEYETKQFGVDGGSDSLSIHADRQVSWTAVVSDPTWITIFGSASGTGDGEITYIVTQYIGDGIGRAGSITVGNRVVRIVQLAQGMEQGFPELHNVADVALVLAAATDRHLGERIRNMEEYEAFRAWIAEKGLDQQAVKDSPHAWVSYVLGSERLCANEPTIQIDGLAIEDDGAKGEEGCIAMDVSVTVKDGEQALLVDAGKVARMFDATGDLGNWFGLAKLGTSARQTGNTGATMQFKVVPGDGTANKAFLGLSLKARQTISFARIGTLTPTNNVKLSATATGGGAITFEVVSGPGVIEGDVLSFTGMGTVVVQAVQAGNDHWLPATAVQSVLVAFGYVVVDLSAGCEEDAVYPVSFLDAEPEGGWTDEYKTTKLVLHRIEAGTFTMGSPTNELGRYGREIQHKVTISKPFYMGVFEVTQKQWELVMGSNPSYYNNPKWYAMRPVDLVSYSNIRGNSIGAGWPGSAEVDATSFMGLLRARTGGIEFDLPTEAQWEYACRAGTETALNSNKNLEGIQCCENMAEVGRYTCNDEQDFAPSASTAGGTAEVGSYRPNAWGLYDMHGNVLEWCLDWYGDYDTEECIDPRGAASGSIRVWRGGATSSNSQNCRSAYRSYASPESRKTGYGFRVGLP